MYRGRVLGSAEKQKQCTARNMRALRGARFNRRCASNRDTVGTSARSPASCSMARTRDGKLRRIFLLSPQRGFARVWVSGFAFPRRLGFALLGFRVSGVPGVKPRSGPSPRRVSLMSGCIFLCKRVLSEDSTQLN